MTKNFWEKLNSIEFKLGPPPKPPKVYTPEEEFGRTTASLLWTASGIAGMIILIPCFFDLVPLIFPKITEGFRVLRFLFFLVTPVLCVIFFARFSASVFPLHSAVFGRYWATKLSERGKLWTSLLLVPVIRHFFLIKLALKMGEEKHQPNFPLLTTLSAGCAFTAWWLWITHGFLSTNPGWVMMTLSVIISILSIKQFLGVPFDRRIRRSAIFFVLIAVPGFLWLGAEKERLDRELAQERAKAAELKIPLDAEEAERHYYGGHEANATFTALVNRYRDNREEAESFDILKVNVSEDLSDAQEKRLERRTFLESTLARDYFNQLDALAVSGEILKYQLQPESLIVNWKLPYLSFYRMAAYSYRWRIIAAAERNDQTEAMRLLRLFTQFQESVLQSEWVIGSLVAVSSEIIRANSIARLIGLGGLSNADILEIQSMNQGRERKIRRSSVDGMRGDTAMQMNVCETFLLDPIVILRMEEPQSLNERQWYIVDKINGKTPGNHLFGMGILNSHKATLLWLLQSQRMTIEYLLQGDDYYQRAAERRQLEDFFKLRPDDFWVHSLALSWTRYIRMVERGIAVLRMSNIALELERQRRLQGILPKLSPDLPREPLSGNEFDLTSGKIKVWKTQNKKDTFQEFDGWQIHGSGISTFLTPEERTKAAEDFFNVITNRSEVQP